MTSAVFLHVDARSVAGVALHIDGAAPHGVAGGVPHAAVDDDGAVVHGVPHGVLRIAPDGDGGAGEIGAQRIAGDALDLHCGVAHAGGDIPLPQTAGQAARLLRRPQPGIEGGVIRPRGVDRDHSITHPLPFFYGFFLRYTLFSGVTDAEDRQLLFI